MFCDSNDLEPLTTKYIFLGVSRQKRGVLGLFGAALTIGASVINAANKFEEKKEERKAAVLLEISNYCRWALSNAQYDIYAGATYDQPGFILAGHKEGLTIIQDDNNGISGLAAWQLDKDHYCLFYFNIEASSSERSGNNIGVGCTDAPVKTLSTIIESIPESAAKGESNEYMSFQQFTPSKLSTLQHCVTAVCIQITCGSSHQPRASIYLIPRNKTDVAPSIQDEVSQEDINLILIDDDDCLLSCDDSDHSSPVVTSKTCIFLQKYTNICLSVLACTLAVCAIVLTGVYICRPTRCRDY